ncbi:MAG: hypothetical protein DCC68_26835, partial [Planctomycetota bacterium]
ITGLAFDNSQRLLVSSYRTGVVHALDLAAPSPPQAPAALVDAVMQADHFRVPPVREDATGLGARRMRRMRPHTTDIALEQIHGEIEMPQVRRLAADARVVRRVAVPAPFEANE